MKSATGLTGSGSRDWVVQRMSAIVLAVYTVVVLGWILCHSGTQTLDYAHWYGFMMTLPMKLFSLVAIVSIAGHAWVGMWTVFTDYITESHAGSAAVGLRLVLQAATIISIFVFVFWGIQIFW